MRRFFGWTLALALVSWAAGAQTVQQKVSGAAGQLAAEQLVETEATVKSIDLATREVVLATKAGVDLAVTAGPEVKRLDEIKVGDTIVMQYYESLTLALARVEGGAAAMTESAGEVRSAPADLPGGIKTKSTTLTAKVTAVDKAANTVTVVGPKGRSVTLDVEADVAAKLAVGDLVSATYTEALAVSVSRVKVN